MSRLRDKESWIVQAKREREYEKEHPELIEEKVAELKEIRKRKDMTRAEQNNGLEKEIELRIEKMHITPTYEELHGFAMHFYQQAEKDLIEKAVTWWSNNLVESEPTKGHYISAFKKYMENKEDKK